MLRPSPNHGTLRVHNDDDDDDILKDTFLPEQMHKILQKSLYFVEMMPQFRVYFSLPLFGSVLYY